jgi:hypothetical protein
VSEYQYYEFQAIDRPLSAREMATLRRFSSRATITASRFVNSYSYGNFKGDAEAWMEKYFDAFLYRANWGGRVLMLRLPAEALPLREARRYCRGGLAVARQKGDKVILELRSEDENGDEWIEEDGGLMTSLVPLRTELAAGDLRGLYLAWLGCVQAGELDGAEEAPPCPDGLEALSAPQQAIAEFLRLDHRLIAAAAAGCERRAAQGDKRKLERWVRGLSEADKDRALVQFMEGEGASVRGKLLRLFRAAQAGPESKAQVRRRTVADLLAAAEGSSSTGKGGGGTAKSGRR